MKIKGEKLEFQTYKLGELTPDELWEYAEEFLDFQEKVLKHMRQIRVLLEALERLERSIK